MLTIGLIGIVSAIAVVQIGNAQQSIRGDGGMRIVLAQLNTARESSISQRRNLQVTFVAPNVLRITRQEVPAGTTVIASVLLEGGIQYDLEPGLPDTADAFGNGQAIDFGTATALMFSSDGTFVDQTGNPVNGTVFLASPGQPRSARAITVLGAVGRIRAYRWDGARWVRV